MTTRADLLRHGSARIAAAGIRDAAREARLLLRWAAGLEGAALAAALDEVPGAAEAERWTMGLDRRAAREPLSHIMGTREFWGHQFRVTSDLLDPRPETEVLVGEAIHRGPFRRVLDLGVGSGCILLSLLAAWPAAVGVGTDLSSAALAVASDNARRLGVVSRAQLLEADWFGEANGPFDLIVSNPPYVTAAEVATLSPEVRLHEPHAALTPGGDGLDAYRAIAPGLMSRLAPGGIVLLEIGPAQSEQVAHMLAATGLRVRAILPDLDQRPRVVMAVR